MLSLGPSSCELPGQFTFATPRSSLHVAGMCWVWGLHNSSFCTIVSIPCIDHRWNAQSSLLFFLWATHQQNVWALDCSARAPSSLIIELYFWYGLKCATLYQTGALGFFGLHSLIIFPSDLAAVYSTTWQNTHAYEWTLSALWYIGVPRALADIHGRCTRGLWFCNENKSVPWTFSY